ncbi:hypothetical protein CCP2SC5_330002 [Azospirillaceae bacterium]
MSRSTRSRISYEPYLFGLAVVGSIYKLVASVQEGRFRADWVLGAVILVFIISSILWFINTRPKNSSSSIDVKVETGKVLRGTVVGAEASARDSVRAEVKTHDATDAKITGYRET